MNRKTTIILGVSVALVATAGFAIARTGYKHHERTKARFVEMFNTADADGDKAVSQAELSTMLNERFAQADADKDGKATKAEIVSHIETVVDSYWASRASGRIADRVVSQLDIDQDGSVTLTELQNRVGKGFAIVEWNDDQKVEVAEIQRMRMGRRGHGKWGHGDRGHGRWGHERWGNDGASTE